LQAGQALGAEPIEPIADDVPIDAHLRGDAPQGHAVGR
jgi:hypothetical protein